MVNLNAFQFYFLDRERMLLLAQEEVYENNTKSCEALRSWREEISVGKDLQPSSSPADQPIQG